MKKILFLRSKNAFLPEINAYINYFNKTNKYLAFDSSEIQTSYKLEDFDVIWEFKGLGGIRHLNRNQLLIHEYPSLSTGKNPYLKDAIKTKFNRKPDLRIFLNKNVKENLKFNDEINYCYRDMGVEPRFTQYRNSKKEYDFVYVGEITKERKIDELLHSFSKKNNGKLCLIGNIEDSVYNQYKNNKDITFTGKVSFSEVPRIASKAIYGINFIPNKYPYNIQTSTKLLEYIALGLNIVTTDYEWVRQFQRKYDSSFYYLDKKNIGFDKNSIEKKKLETNLNIERFYWDNIIENSKVEEYISKLLYIKS